MDIKTCRLCGSSGIREVINLGHHPLADTFVPLSQSKLVEKRYPLSLGLCSSCGHVFTLFSVSGEERYQEVEYSYVSSNSKVSLGHFDRFAADLIERYGLSQDSTVLDIGSNDGTFLEAFKLRGCNVLGIDPSPKMVSIARGKGINSVANFFGQGALNSVDSLAPYNLVVSANVLNHIDDLIDVFLTVRSILHDRGTFVFQVPYLGDLLAFRAFDTIYHEHVHYHSVSALTRALNNCGFGVVDVEFSDYMCGSVRLHCRVGVSNALKTVTITEQEHAVGLFRHESYTSFMADIGLVKIKVVRDLCDIKMNGGEIAGIGAATKGNTFLNYCGIDSSILSFLTDSSELKVGKIAPGSRLEIKHDNYLGSGITHGLILPRNIETFLKSKLSHFPIEFYSPQLPIKEQYAQASNVCKS